jgi:hypothetical protein
MMLIPLVSLLIPIVAIIMGIGIGMLALFLKYRRRKDIFSLYHQERMAALEKGVELPPLPDALFNEDGRPCRSYNPRRHLLKGLVGLFFGVGLGIALYMTVGQWAFFALVPIGVGLAHLIYYFVEGKNEAKELEASQPAPQPKI